MPDARALSAEAMHPAAFLHPISPIAADEQALNHPSGPISLQIKRREGIMWDFDIGKTFSLMLRTLPFIGFRLAIYFGITLAYIAATGGGAGIGYMLGRILQDADGAGSGAFWGGLVGFSVVSGALYFAREYLLYIVKAGHIAVLVHLLDDRPIPEGKGQIAYGAQIVKARFVEASVLFGVDRMIQGILRAFNRTVLTLSGCLPIPGLTTGMKFVTAVIHLSLAYVDEAILAYIIRTHSENPWAGARDGVILYAQNYRMLLKNAVSLAIFAWILSFGIFLLAIAPVAALVAWIPGLAGFWLLILAIVAAYALKAALVDPFVMTCIVQVYFKAIEGQRPSPEWAERLNSISARFRELGEKAAALVAGKSRLPTPATNEPISHLHT
jgi:hypothetical protein